MKHRVYIDEVGNPDLESSDDPNHRFLSLTGVILEWNYVQSVVHPQMEDLKRKYFAHHPDDPVIFHRSEMLNALSPFLPLRDSEVRCRFDADLLDHLASWEYTVVTVCLDKKKHKETYSVWRYDPYHYCLTLLLERFVLFLTRKGGRGDALAESRGGKEDRRLMAAYTRLWQNGTDFLQPEEFQRVLTSRELKI